MRLLRFPLLVLTTVLLVAPASTPPLSAATGAAQPASHAAAVPVTLGQSVVALTGPWKFHVGDNPKWADPSYDDSGWQPYELLPGHSPLTPDAITQSSELPGWQHHGHPGYAGYAWYRIRLRPPLNAQSTALLMPRFVDDAYEVYLNGSKIGSFGKLNGWQLTYAGQSELFSIPAAELDGDRPVTLALRFWNLRAEASAREQNLGGGLRGVPLLGPPAQLRVFQQSMQQQTWQSQGGARQELAVGALYGAVGLISLFLFLFSRGQQEYLWAGISLTGLGTMLASIVVSVMQQTMIPGQVCQLAGAVGDQCAVFAMPLTAMYLLSVPRLLWRRANYVASALNLAWVLQNVGFDLGLLPPTAAINRLHAVTEWLAIPLMGCLLLAIAVDGVRSIGNEAWLPMTPGLLFTVYCNLFMLFSLGILKGSFLFPRIISACVPLSVLIIFLIRFTRQQRENVRLVDDMLQAQEVQNLLIPSALPNLPGWLIESEYRPARQVGGDFFQVLPDDDGSLLIVVGDVSGKGLKAAMTVSAIVGALRDGNTRQPALVLAHLNRVLSGQIDGFVTCSAALIATGGAMTLANAGHLSPYRNGEELPVPGGLPLGLLAEATYDEMHFELTPGDRLTFVSDGVVEATNARRELFGFDRMAALTAKPAAEIATAAQHWGQEDDITVLSVTRTVVPVSA
ncbi:MAG TPA: SpoIIE family protein phosphatase [Terracidiphilus sp.]|nr:SpoIIE family protein phosphatase [Terracidiphilus sp.]